MDRGAYLVVMLVTIGQPLPLVMSMSQERLLAYRTHEMLKIVPCFHNIIRRMARNRLTSTCQLFPRAVTTLSSMGR